MAQAKKGDSVQVHYTGTLADGTIFDSSTSRAPIAFVVGEQLLIPAFEQAVIGMEPGEAKTISVPAADGYGHHREDLVVEVDRNRFPDDLTPETGQQLEVTQENGQVIPVVVTAVSAETVTLDANHPLSGKDLVFDIELVNID